MTTKRAPRWLGSALLGAIVAVDAATANLCVCIAFLVRLDGVLRRPNWAAVQYLWAPFTVALVAGYSLVGLYTRHRELCRVELGSMVVRGNVLWLLASFAIAYLRRDVAGAYPTAVFFLSAAFHATLSYEIHVVWEWLKTQLDLADRVRRAVLIGATPEARKLREAASTRANFEYARNKARYDLIYLKNRSFMLDLKILAKTVAVVAAGRGAR